MAVKPPEDVLDAVAAAVAPARSVRVGLRWEQRERYHLTLQFLGPVPKLAPVVDGLAAAVTDRSAFSVQLGGAGAFPKPGRARVVWVGPAAGGPDLVGLAAAVAGGLRPHGYEPDRKEFHPHLTLARLKVPDNVAEVLAAIGSEPVGEPFTVGEVVLYQSQLSSKGPTYTVLERFPLRGA
ncbi:MAG TPA: RNA 2',3'-cyclic phosphodiesterase [Acidimicrobiia bacterium]|nr:RNA 2',3'-cyclic phosphodiesterase [Acidimicrobiia bacterium]